MSDMNRIGAPGAFQFVPGSRYDGPAHVMADPDLSNADKREILSSWASDMYAVESAPALRKIPGIRKPIRIYDILGALRELDERQSIRRDTTAGRPLRGTA